MNASETAKKLNTNQRIVLADLNISQPITLGCIEKVAFHLCRASKTRPALVKHCGKGAFVLTAEGAQVKDHL